jgi:hypothetical protein
MTSPEERRDAQLTAVVNAMYDPDEYERAYDGLLAYFDENEPEVADAIRYGVRIALVNDLEDGHVARVIDYPEGHSGR